MKMRNQNVIENFIHQIFEGKGSNLYIDNNKLVNYNTTIAQWENGTLLLNVTKYSQTTSKNQNIIKKLAENLINVIELDNVPMNTYNLKKYHYANN